MRLKLTILLVLIFSLSLFEFSELNQEPEQQNPGRFRSQAEPVITALGLYSTKGAFDLVSDYNNTVHMVWYGDDGSLHYGNIVGTEVINQEIIPNSSDCFINFARPRIMARPDGESVHITWMTPRPGTKCIHVWKDSGGWHREIVWTGSFVSVPMGVADLTGKMHIIGQVWNTNTPTGFSSKIKYWHKEPGGEYNRGWSLIEGSVKWRDTHMFIDQNGGIHATFKSGRDPGKYVYCDSGGSLIDSPIEDIPVAPGGVCVSFGDLFVDPDGNVHHAHMTYNNETIDYVVRDATTGIWGDQYRISEDAIQLCYHHEYDNAWPGIAVGPEGVIYATWADMPCPDKEANRITLATKEAGMWSKEILTLDAHIDFNSKPAITANANGVYLMWRDWQYELYLYSIISKELYITTPSPGQNICGDDDVTKIAVDSLTPANIATVDFYVDGEHLGTAETSPFEIEWDTSLYEKGEHTIRVEAQKTDGSSLEDEITVDMNCPPTVAIVNLRDGANVAGLVEVVAQPADDQNAVNRVDFYVNGSFKYSAAQEPYVYTWNTAGYELGNHTIRVVAYDDSSLSDEDSVTVNHYPIYPPLNLTAQAGVSRSLFVKEYYTDLAWVANPQNTSIIQYRIYVVDDGERELVGEVDANTFQFRHRDANPLAQSFAYAVTAVDAAGHESIGAYQVVARPLD